MTNPFGSVAAVGFGVGGFGSGPFGGAAVSGILVQLDDFTGQFPYDITQYVRLPDSISWTRGRPDEHSDMQPGTITLTLDNIDGRFTQGSVAYGIAPNQQIRLIVLGVTRFTGRVQSWPVVWPAGGQEFAKVTASGLDFLTQASLRTLRSAADEEILVDNPAAYFPLSEANGATTGGDISGNDVPPLVPVNPVLPFTWGTPLSSVATPPLDGMGDGSTGAQSPVSATTGLGLSTLGMVSLGGQWTGTTLQLEITAQPLPVNATPITLVTMPTTTPGTSASLTLDNTGTLSFTGTGALAGVSIAGTWPNDGKYHVFAVQADAVDSVLWVDGGKVALGGPGFPTTWKADGVSVGTSLGPPNVIRLAKFSFGQRLANVLGPRIALHNTVIRTDWAGLSITARLIRICKYVGITVGTTTFTTAICGPSGQAGKTAFDVFNELSAATLGFTYVGSDGRVNLNTGAAVAARVTPDLSIDANYVAEDTAFTYDTWGVTNVATGTTPATGNVARAVNTASRAKNGDFISDYTWNVSTDAQVSDRVRWMVNNFGTPNSRVPTLKLDVLTMDSATTASALALDVSKFLRITGMPSQTPGGTTADLIVQGVTETINLGLGGAEWSLTLNCTRRVLYSGWVLDDPTYSALGATTKLYL